MAPEDTIVTRRIERPADEVARQIDAGRRRHDRLVPTWSAARRLGLTTVDVEVAAWSGDSAELTLRPRSRRAHRWTAWRARRYFDRAHQFADRLSARLAGECQKR